MRYGYAGNREIAVEILAFLLSQGFTPQFLIVDRQLSHSQKLIDLSQLAQSHVFDIQMFDDPDAVSRLSDYDVDYIFGIHFPCIINQALLSVPRVGFLNLHPAYLPYNKGWNTPSWAIMDQTPYGATLHFMSQELDGGDIIIQRQLKVEPHVTANELYQHALLLEKQIFIEALPDLLTLKPNRTPQSGSGSSHGKKDLAAARNIDLNQKIAPIELIDKIRALTTNNIEEAAYFVLEDKKYRLQLSIVPE